MIEFRPYEPGDVFKIDVRPEMKLTEQLIKNCDASGGYGFAYSFVSGDNILACLGGDVRWQGNMEVWTVIGSEMLKYPKTLYSKTKKSLETYALALKLNRVQMHVRCGFKQAEQFAERLGFVKEGVMKRYLPDGCDATLYARYF